MLNIQVKNAETSIIKGVYTFSVEYFLLNIFLFKALKYAYFGAYRALPCAISFLPYRQNNCKTRFRVSPI